MYHVAYATLFGSLDRQLQQFAGHKKAPVTAYCMVEDVVATKNMGECAICKEAIKKGVEVHTTTCAHSYHRTCLDEWFKIKRTCPVCRTEQ